MTPGLAGRPATDKIIAGPEHHGRHDLLIRGHGLLDGEADRGAFEVYKMDSESLNGLRRVFTAADGALDKRSNPPEGTAADLMRALVGLMDF
jgi:hypothetical protein